MGWKGATTAAFIESSSRAATAQKPRSARLLKDRNHVSQQRSHSSVLYRRSSIVSGTAHRSQVTGRPVAGVASSCSEVDAVAAFFGRCTKRRSAATACAAAAKSAAGRKALWETEANSGPATEPKSPAAEASCPVRESSSGAMCRAK